MILLIVGIIGFVISLFFWSSRGGFGRAAAGTDPTTGIQPTKPYDQSAGSTREEKDR